LALLPFGAYFGPRVGMGFEKNKSSGSETKIIDLSTKFPTHLGLVAGIRVLGFRADLEYNCALNLAKSTIFSGVADDIDGHSMLFNLYYNLLDVSFLKFYLNGGLGGTMFAKRVAFKKTNSSFSWLAGAGITFSLINIINLDLGYRFINLGEVKLGNSNLKQNSNNIYLGLRFGF
jgi:opacity protein-like surface antigen